MASRNIVFMTMIPIRYALSTYDAGMPTPKSWVLVLPTDATLLESGHLPSRKHPEYWDGDIPMGRLAREAMTEFDGRSGCCEGVVVELAEEVEHVREVEA